ncbi:hypothetical protein AB0N05_28135 [Nocardia sp. NPDC051030]|uniref:hypothetical protein n=1 Tax=Nocardia sp. NPDC051030 TaxID=3155162 RepID=UPI003423D5E3
MKHFAKWLQVNIDGIGIVLIAITVAMLAILDVLGSDQIAAATLAVLALVAATILRERHGLSRAVRDTTAVRLLYGPEIAEAHTMARRDTDKWCRKGGTGTYLRAVTLPELFNKARREQRTVRLQVEILDPTNEQRCQDDAHYRSTVISHGGASGPQWTVDRIRKQSFATVLAACWYRQQSDFLLIEIALASTSTTYRWDLSDSCVIMTQRYPVSPALLFERGKPHYQDLTRELARSFKQARPLAIGRDDEPLLAAEPTVEQIRQLFEHLRLPLPGTYTDRDIVDIARFALRADDPFSR